MRGQVRRALGIMALVHWKLGFRPATTMDFTYCVIILYNNWYTSHWWFPFCPKNPRYLCQKNVLQYMNINLWPYCMKRCRCPSLVLFDVVSSFPSSLYLLVALAPSCWRRCRAGFAAYRTRQCQIRDFRLYPRFWDHIWIRRPIRISARGVWNDESSFHHRGKRTRSLGLEWLTHWDAFGYMLLVKRNNYRHTHSPTAFGLSDPSLVWCLKTTT